VHIALEIVAGDADLKVQDEQDLARYAIALAQSIVHLANNLALKPYNLAIIQDNKARSLACQHTVSAVLKQISLCHTQSAVDW
jgi:hypothetical protein